MSEFKIQSPTGSEISLSENEYFYLLNVDNQTFFDTSIYSTNSTSDGDTINSIKANPRTLTFTLSVKPYYDVEDVKRYIFKHLKPKKKHTIVWTRNSKTLVIDGVFDSATMPRWTNNVSIQLSFYCSDCFWRDKNNVVQEINDVISMHYFTEDEGEDMLFFFEDGIVMGEYDLGRTRQYENLGDVETGLTITIHAVDDVTNPIIYLNTPDNYIGINDTLKKDDIVIITTTRGNKSIVKNGVPILQKLKEGSSFIQLSVGNNTFSVDSDDDVTDNMYFTVSYQQQYV